MEPTSPVLADFIRQRRREILAAWTTRIGRNEPLLGEHMPGILDGIAAGLAGAPITTGVWPDCQPADIVAELAALRDYVCEVCVRENVVLHGSNIGAFHRAVDRLLGASMRDKPAQIVALVQSLRNPLSSILLAAGLLERKLGKRSAPDPMLIRQTQLILRAAARMEKIIEDIEKQSER
jgi:signal transduction histidine kinase